MIIAVASDHGGFALKDAVKLHLLEKGIEVADLGTYNEDSVDYPEFGKKCAEEVASGKADKGIVCCGIEIIAYLYIITGNGVFLTVIII